MNKVGRERIAWKNKQTNIEYWINNNSPTKFFLQSFSFIHEQTPNTNIKHQISISHPESIIKKAYKWEKQEKKINERMYKRKDEKIFSINRKFMNEWMNKMQNAREEKTQNKTIMNNDRFNEYLSLSLTNND